MGVLLLVLKIIGIILAVILALILGIILIVLFVPFRYRVSASYYHEPDINASVSWLLHIVSVCFSFSSSDKKCIIRILGIPILDLLHPKEKKKKSDKTNNNTKNKAKKNASKKKNGSNTKNIEAASTKKSEKRKVTTDSTIALSNVGVDNHSFDNQMSLEDFGNTVDQTVQKAQNAKEQAEKWLIVLQREKTKKAIEKCKDILIKILKTILPRKWSSYIHLGLKDPAATGQILGYYWMLLGAWTDKITFVPEFENEVIEGELKAKGHIRTVTFIIVGLKVLLDPDLKYLRKIKAEVDAL